MPKNHFWKIIILITIFCFAVIIYIQRYTHPVLTYIHYAVYKYTINFIEELWPRIHHKLIWFLMYVSAIKLQISFMKKDITTAPLLCCCWLSLKGQMPYATQQKLNAYHLVKLYFKTIIHCRKFKYRTPLGYFMPWNCSKQYIS